MKTKLDMAHDYAMLHMMMDRYKDVDDLEMIQWANDYADKMQAEVDKRKVSGVPEAIRENSHIFGSPAPVRPFLTKDKDGNCTHFHHEFGHKKCMDCGACLEQWQPDWSQAPEWAVAWTKDSGETLWWSYIPWFKNNFWFVDDSIIWQCGEAPSFGYTGDWSNSLRKRP